MGFYSIFKKAKNGVHTAFSRKGVFGRKGIVASGNLFKKQGWKAVKKFGSDVADTADDLADGVNDVVNKIESVPIIGALASPITGAVKGVTGAEKLISKQARGIGHVVADVGDIAIKLGKGKKHHADLRNAKADVAKRIAEIRGKK